MGKIKSKKLLTGLMTLVVAGTMSCAIPTKSNAAINLAPRIYQKSSSSTNIVLEFKDNSGLKSVKVNGKEVISKLKNQEKSGSKITSGTYEIKKTKETSKSGVDYKIVVEDLSGKKFTDPITTYYSTSLKKLYMNRAPRISISGDSTNSGYYKTATLEIDDNSKFKSAKLFKKVSGSYNEITDFSKASTATLKDKEGKKVTKLEDAVELTYSLKSLAAGSYKIEATDKTGKKQTRTFDVIEKASSSTDTTKKEETEKKEDTTKKEETEKKEDTTKKEETEKKEDTTTSKEYKYIQNIDCAPRYSLDVSNKDYVLIKFNDNVGVDTNSINIYQYNSTTKKYDKEIKREVLKENEVVGKTKVTTVKVLRKNISTKSEAVKIKIVAQDKDKNVNGINAYIVIKPLDKENNKRWYSIDNAPRISFSDKVECKTEEDAFKQKINVKLEDNQGIKSLDIYDLNNSTTTKVLDTITGKTSYTLDLSTCTVKKAPSGANACKIRFVIVDKNGRTRDEVMYFTARKYEMIPATSLELSSENLTINKGETATLKATIKPDNTTDLLKFESSDKNIATVDSTGKITAIKEGTATITATVGNLKKECKVTVKVKMIPATSLELSSENLTINKGETATLKATIKPDNTTDALKYESSDKNIATVDSTGKIKAIKEGTVTITATVGNLKKECKVTVKEVKEENDNKENTTGKTYKYTQNVDCAPRYSLDVSNKDYVLIKFNDNVGVDTNSIQIYQYNSTTKKYDKEIKREVLKENEVVGKTKVTTVKVLRKNISTKNEAVKIKIVAQDKSKNVSNIQAYLVIKPLAKENNKKWYSLDNAPRISFSGKVECKTEEEALKQKINIKLEDNQGIKSLELYDLNSATPTKAKETATGKTSYTLDLSKYTVKKAPSGVNACKIRFVIVDKNGRIRNEVMYFTVGKTEIVPATSLELSSENLTINKGEAAILKATIKPDNTSDQVKYESSDKNIATVDSTGKITAIKEGTVTITATVGNIKKECKVTVKEVKEESDKKEETDNKDTTTSKEYRYIQNLDCAPRYSLDVSNKDYVLIKLNDNVGVDTNSIKIYKYNSTTKKYDKEIKREVLKENEVVGKTKVTTVKVLRKNISTKSEAVKIKIVAQDKDKNLNGINAYIVMKPLDKENNKRWYSIDNAPRIYFSDKVECKTEEDALKKKINIKLEDNQGIKSLELYDLNGSTPTKVKEAVTGKTSYTLDLSTYTVKKSPSGVNACKIRFVIADKNGRTRNEVMYFTARKYERIPATTLNLSSENLTINKGETKTLKATIKPSNTTDMIKYTSSDKNIATVDSTGKITAKSGGTATITATVGDLKKECKVTVKEVKVEKVTLNKTNITLNQTNYKMITEKTVSGQPTATLKATITPSNATDKTIKYTSSNKKVATVDSNGKITAHLQGTATITATAANGKKATCKVVVGIKAAPGYTAYSASLSPKKVEVKKGEVFNLEVFFTGPNVNGSWSYYVMEQAEYDVKKSRELFVDVDDPNVKNHRMRIGQKNTLRLKATKKGTFHLVFETDRIDNGDIIVVSNEVEIVVK